MPGCISCALGCSIASIVCRALSETACERQFGMSGAAAPHRFLVGLAALNLRCAAAEDRPLVCLVDDAQ